MLERERVSTNLNMSPTEMRGSRWGHAAVPERVRRSTNAKVLGSIPSRGAPEGFSHWSGET
eukprot:3621744-Prymnesium_polylepis.1